MALPGGGWAIAADRSRHRYDNDNRYVTMINSSGMVIGESYTWMSDKPVTGLIYYQPWVYIIERDDTITKIREDLDPDTASVVKVKSDEAITKIRKDLHHTDSIIHPGDIIQKDVLLLTNRTKGTVFTYNMNTMKEKTKITGLAHPVHVFRCDMDGQPVYVVTERFDCKIKIYNSQWNLMREFGRPGSQDGELMTPECTVILPNGDFLVADTWNNRISQFRKDGIFVKHLITGLYMPTWMSFRDFMLWVVDVEGRAACFQIIDKVAII